MEREYPEMCNWGDMTPQMVWTLSRQTPSGTVVQFHNNGDPLLYPKLGWALQRFDHCIRQFNTNGKLLAEKASEIIGNLEVLAISVIENDPEGDEQYEIVNRFLDRKGSAKPHMVYRLLGDVEKDDRWEALPGVIARRVLHAPGGSYDYKKKVTVPEIGICLDLLTHLAVDRHGNISLCVRFDPKGHLRLGNIKDTTLEGAWNGAKRKQYLEKHIDGNRDSCPGCDSCEFWGVPRGD